MIKDEKKEQKVKKFYKLVIFDLDKEEFGVNIEDVREVINVPQFTLVPNTPSFVKGIFTLRGKVVIGFDLEKRFRLVREDDFSPRHVIIFSSGGSNFGMIVDKVKGIIDVSEKAIQTTPDIVSSKIDKAYLKGIVVLNNIKKNIDESIQDRDREKETSKKSSVQQDSSRLIVLLDIKKLLNEEEMKKIQTTGNSIK